VECNRHLKFDRLLARAEQLGFDALATGHHARAVNEGGRWALRRGADTAKDQSYVLYMLGQTQLGRLLLPVGELTKGEVRERAAAFGLRTAAKPESQDTCFITATGGRERFLATRIALHPGRIVEQGTGRHLGTVPAVELVTVGQRRGLDSGGAARRRYAVDVDVTTATVTVGEADGLLTGGIAVTAWGWVDEPVGAGTAVLVQSSAHGRALPGTTRGDGVVWNVPQRRVASGQVVVLYDGSRVLGGGIAA
jgi:tRNA-specific 2-thiouridylase